MRDYELIQLPNGLRVLHKQVTGTKIVHCGFILDIGSRDEKPEQQGLAHFWEHMAFKGTEKRKAFHILNRIDSVGGELNAYTTKEKICFYVSVLDQHFDTAVELLTDITFNSIFPEKQIENEKNVILEEMSMYIDSPEDAIQDDFDEVIFGDHPLGKNILGTVDTVRSFTRDDFEEFLRENMDTERIIFSCTGNISLEKVKRLANKYLTEIPHYKSNRKRLPFEWYQPRKIIKNRALTQAHCAIGRTSYSILDDKRLPFFTLINILGGPGMNSRLNLAIREKYGFVYSIDASYNSYIDTGILGIFYATEPKQINKSIALVLKELKKMKEVPLGTMQLHRAKEQLIGQLAMAEENNMSLMLMMAKSILDQNKVDSLEEIFDEIRSLTALQLQEIALEMFDEDQLSFLTFKPE
jgi:predicted Zn-dependent peptidase